MQINTSAATEELLASQAAMSQTTQKIQTAVAKKQLDAQKQSGAAVVQLLQNAAQVTDSSTGHIDFYA